MKTNPCPHAAANHSSCTQRCFLQFGCSFARAGADRHAGPLQDRLVSAGLCQKMLLLRAAALPQS
eukprot:1463322-Amphidinium_carterae.3